METIVPHILAFVFVLLIASCASMLFKKLKFPYTIGLVIIGILSAFFIDNFEILSAVRDLHLSHDIIFYIILPTLIFEAAVNVDTRLLLKNLVPVIVLAVPGLLISMLIIGFCLSASTPLSLGVAMLFGTLISATDPVAVIGLFKEIGAPKRLTLLVDGESLFNDATAIVAFNLVISIILSGTALNSATFAHAILEFFVIFVGGLSVGILIGYIVSFLINLCRNDPLTQIALSTVVAYTAFIAAEHILGVSGVMSVLGAGIVVSYFGATRFTPSAKEYLEQFWEYAAFVANTFIFFLIGITEWELFIVQGHSANIFYYILITIIVVIIARFIIVYGLMPFVKPKINFKYQSIIFWGGLRGAVPLALALSLSSDFPGQQLILEFTLGVVLFSLLIQGTTTKKLIKLLKINDSSFFDKILACQAKKFVLQKTKNFIVNDFKYQSFFPKEITDKVLEDYNCSLEETQKELQNLKEDREFNYSTVKKLTWFQATQIEKKSYRFLFEKGLISESAFRELDLKTEITKDQIDAEKHNTPARIQTVHFELKFKIILFNLIKFIVPNIRNRVLKIKEKLLISNFEIALSMAIAEQNVATFLKSASQDYENHQEIIDHCREFYRKRTELAISKNKNFKNNLFISKLRKRAIYKAAINFELDALDELEANSGLPDSVINSLKTEAVNQVSDLHKMNYSLFKTEFYM